MGLAAANETPERCVAVEGEMKLHQWKTSFETGNAVIDAQHRELVESLKTISTLIGEGKGKQAFAECLTFRELTRNHFTYESKILHEAEFPRLETHLEDHKTALGKLEEIFSDCGMICKESVPCPCMEDLSFVTVDHIVRNDLDFKSHLQTKNLADDDGA